LVDSVNEISCGDPLDAAWISFGATVLVLGAVQPSGQKPVLLLDVPSAYHDPLVPFEPAAHRVEAWS
jgi:hypothetical protein